MSEQMSVDIGDVEAVVIARAVDRIMDQPIPLRSSARDLLREYVVDGLVALVSEGWQLIPPGEDPPEAPHRLIAELQASRAEVERLRAAKAGAWSRGRSYGQAVAESELKEWQKAWLHCALADIYKPEGVDIWVASPNKLLQGRKPVDLLGTPAFADAAQVVDLLVSGAYA